MLFATTAAQAQITIAGNVFGGARQADVDGSSTVTVLDGNIQNVYGGNDISGTVKGGTNLEIRHSIIGDVFGGGNGAYYYTTHSDKLSSSPYYQLYTVPEGSEAIDVLSAYIPHQEAINIHIVGTSANDPTFIGGRVFCGGNCATVKGSASLKLGSHVIAGSVFLGSNGEALITENALNHYASASELGLNSEDNMKKYMAAVAVTAKPALTFDEGYVDYSTKIGSFFCGGNAGSMKVDGLLTLNFNKKFIIYEKLVGGSNTALVPAKSGRNYAYEGGVIGNAGTGNNKLTMNLQGIRLEPRILTYDATNGFTFDWNVDDRHTTEGENASNDDRLVGANIYGGCYTSGIVNGNVTINILETTAEKDNIFSDAQTEGNSGIPLDQQGNDPLGSALNIYGGGYGEQSEIRGNTVLNVNNGYSFQVFGGGEMGNVTGNCTVNLNGGEVEYLYGGGFVGPVQGNTLVNLGGGKVYDVYGGSCNADINGYTEVFIGRNGSLDDAFPTIRHGVFGGNDLGGTIRGAHSHNGHRISEESVDTKTTNTYVEYLMGSVGTENDDGNAGIYGGNFGNYDYSETGEFHAYPRPFAESSFVNFKPKAATTSNTLPANNYVVTVFGGSLGTTGDYTCSTMQHDSYVLVEAPQSATNYTETDIYGGGAYAGMGDKVTVEGVTSLVPGAGHTVVDLYTGQVRDVFGGCNKEGLLGYARVNVPESSTINVHSLFGGGKGYAINSGDFDPTLFCDTYVTLVDYNSENARVKDAIYGGNMNCRIACDTYLNITKPVWSDRESGYIASVYGAGYGRKTVSGRTHVYLNDGAKVWYAFGGGRDGNTFNYVSLTRWLIKQLGDHYKNMSDGADKTAKILAGVAQYKGFLDSFGDYLEKHPITLPAPISTNVVNNMRTDPENPPYDNTNVFIKKGAVVGNYAFGGGEGEHANVCGTTNIQLLGGLVNKDLYGGGYGGPMEDEFKVDWHAGGELQTLLKNNPNIISTLESNGIDFADTYLPVKTNVYVGGGTCRNVYGGGYQGNIGYHYNAPNGYTTEYDIADAETHVTIGIREDQTDEDLITALTYVKGSTATKTDLGFYCGVPAIERNAYGAGEMSAIYGTTYLTMNNGYIGYRRFSAVPTTDTDLAYIQDGNDYYQEKIHDETWNDGRGENRLKDCGSIYGAGYDDLSSVDFTNVVMWGGLVRSSLHGGGEVATVGRGKIVENDASRVLLAGNYYKAGGTKVTMYNGHVIRNVFGGGRGYNYLGYGGGHKLYTDGYVFGSTEVYIHGGEIGTAEGVIVQEDGTGGYGNVFGGGDVGYVYGKGYFDPQSRTTGTGSPGHTYYYYNGQLTEDCKVVVAPYLQIKKGGTDVTWDNKTYHAYDYVPTEYLNTLPKKSSSGTYDDSRWTNLYTGANKNVANTTDDKEERGVIIRNAVFAGGNVSSNSDKIYANATTVFGNTTATLYDVYHRDFITVGTEHIGGLYGGGNLSVVDGYRELNITNYGTDYYGLNQRISLADYQRLSNRERAYFQLQYVCQQANNNYIVGDKISEEVYKTLPTANQTTEYWIQYGFCSIYAGRLLNTIQRADLCGVFGSRMVLQGAKDRVADVADATAYTINRVGELSLNKQATSAGDTGNDASHGNYFGIYSLVNHLGNLTSDVRQDDYRQVVTTNSSGNDIVSTTTESYYNYKKSAYDTNATPFKDRNKGYSDNQVALASGVFLELTTENSTDDNKEYGYITGIVELDLINVKQDIVGGGYVYAKNEHRVPKYFANKSNVILSEYNKLTNNRLCTYKCYLYDSSKDGTGEWSSANAGTGVVVGGTTADFGQFKAYETSGNFIHRNKTIIDDCYPINDAYVIGGDPYSQAHYWYVKGTVYVYDQVVSAYTGSANAYSKEVNLPLTITAASNGKLKLLDVKPNKYAYKKANGQKIDADGVKVNNESETYYLNDVISYWDWQLLTANEQAYFVDMTYVNAISCKIDGTDYAAGEYVMDETDYNSFNQAFTYTDDHGDVVNSNSVVYATAKAHVFRPSNDIAHNTGYVLTFDMDNPTAWNNLGGTAPSFKPTVSGVYGKKNHTAGEIITVDVYNQYPTGDKAKADEAFVATSSVTYTYNSMTKTVNKGTAIPKGEYEAVSSISGLFAKAYVCVNTLKLAEDKYITKGDLLTAAEIQNLKDTYAKDDDGYTAFATEIQNVMTEAYICKESGLYGGRNYSESENYGALISWCSLSADDRGTFNYNYDALDVLVDPNYTGDTSLYGTPFDEEKSVEYTATLNTSLQASVTYTKDGTTYTVDSSNPTVTSDIFERYITNDKRHFTKLVVPTGGMEFYIAIENFTYGGAPYAKGQIVNQTVYNANQSYVNIKTIENNTSSEMIHYYCYEPCSNYNVGDVISQATYAGLTNYQQYFTIQGMQPTETTTFYVSRESDIRNLSKERIISVIYQYTYNEEEGTDDIKTTSEIHVVNIHLQMESGMPEIGPLALPDVVLPGNTVGMKAPTVSEGLYEVLTSGWEMFNNSEDAENHRNGIDFVNNNTPVYWYQNGQHYVAFYAKTYLGKTYSNSVPLNVANYHDLAAVMADKDHHLYIDQTCLRDPKIYIDQTKHTEENQLDLLKDLFTLSSGGTVSGHSALNTSKVGDCKKLEFFLKSDLSHTGTWTGIGDTGESGHCFEGTLHGDGHTISGLTSSLFNRLCGEVYNLGVTGSFTSAGIADNGSGYLENCWVNTSGTANAKALFNNPKNTANRTVHMVNCYYPTENQYTDHPSDATYGLPTEKPLQAFYNGEVAYDLNDFYLFKRYSDHNTSTITGNDYYYLIDEGREKLTTKVGHYPTNPTGPYLLNDYQNHYVGSYVENRYADGDFRYADGKIPSGNEIRSWTSGEGESAKTVFAPVWPDDYLFFGQMLSYGYDNDHPYQPLPSHLEKNADNSYRLYTDDANNRVFRAPAYFSNSTMGVAHFNPNCILATESSDGTFTAYPDMTAIDFTGDKDLTKGYQFGLKGVTAKGEFVEPTAETAVSTRFYPPLLDDDGLLGIRNVDETQNLLVYTGTATTAAAKTDAVVSAYLLETPFAETNAKYRTVAALQSTEVEAIHGHHVQLSQGNYVTSVDHLLVDRQGFNCPIAYKMGSGKRMWYQREPDNYVTISSENKTVGWEGVSLPFAAELVTTQDKGEITHFYTGSTSGHEYWLRKFNGGSVQGNEFVGNFDLLAVGSNTKKYTNTYLWDYYYSHNDNENSTVDPDKNKDDYQSYEKKYYKADHTFDSYPYNAVGTPYLVGFPGKSYYEFDLSGQWTPSNRYLSETILSPGEQTITFASVAGATVGVSDTELNAGKATKDNYTFMPNYLNKEWAAADKAYILADDGGSYEKNTAGATVSAFRPYIVAAAVSPTRGAEEPDKVERVVFGSDYTNDLLPHRDQLDGNGTLNIYAKKGMTVVVESSLRYTVDVSIYTPAGLVLYKFPVKAGERVEQHVNSKGVYIVHSDDGQYVKKVIVR